MPDMASDNEVTAESPPIVAALENMAAQESRAGIGGVGCQDDGPDPAAVNSGRYPRSRVAAARKSAVKSQYLGPTSTFTLKLARSGGGVGRKRGNQQDPGPEENSTKEAALPPPPPPPNQMVARTLLDTLRSVTNAEEDVAAVLAVLLRLSEDPEPSVRSELVEQLPSIASFCQCQGQLQEEASSGVVDENGGGVAGVLRDVLPRYLLPMVVRYLADANNQVRKASQLALLALLEQNLLGPEELEEQVCPVILHLTDIDSMDNFRPEAVAPSSSDFISNEWQTTTFLQLMCRMATMLGKELTQSLFLDRFVGLCSDSTFQVRKVCAIHFGDLCAVLGPEVTETILLPRFVSLCNDEMWGVRKACADVFVAVACVCSLATRRQHLAQLFVALLADPSRWVRLAVFQALGPFISTFADPTAQQLYYDEDGNVHVAHRPEEDNLDTDDTLPPAPSWPEQQSTPWGATAATPELPEEPGCGDSGFGSTDASTVGSPGKEDDEMEAAAEALEDQEFMQELGSILALRHGIKEKEIVSSPDVETPPQPAFDSFQFWREPIREVDDLEIQLFLADADLKAPICRTGYRRQCRSSEASQKTATQSYDFAAANPYRDPALGEVQYDGPEYRGGHQEYYGFGVPVFAERPGLPTPSLCARQDVVPSDLLNHYVHMNDPHLLENLDIEIARFCAHSLPAVALTLGRKHWSILRALYECLASDMQWKVRRTLAFSIHELAAILGRDLAASDLMPVFNSFVRDLDEVRIGILRHLARFLSLLPSVQRREYLPHVQKFLEPENERNWRFRLELADQLSLMAPLFPPTCVAEHLLPVAVRLLSDRVAEVRTTAAESLGNLVRHVCRPPRFGESESDLRPLIYLALQLVGDFAEHPKWNRRQTFVSACHRLRPHLPLREVFSVHLLPPLLRLTTDPVANVRLAVARVLADVPLAQLCQAPRGPESRPLLAVNRGCASLSQGDDFADDPENFKLLQELVAIDNSERNSVIRALERLRNDLDRDVRQEALRAVFPTVLPSGPASWSGGNAYLYRNVVMPNSDEDENYLAGPRRDCPTPLPPLTARPS